MGRPKELTNEQKQELRDQGYRPVEVWVPDLSKPEVRARLDAELRAMRDSDRRSGELERLSEVVEDLADDFWK